MRRGRAHGARVAFKLTYNTPPHMPHALSVTFSRFHAYNIGSRFTTHRINETTHHPTSHRPTEQP